MKPGLSRALDPRTGALYNNGVDPNVGYALDRSKANPVNSTPLFLDRLVNLTAVQDLEMMEYSLLRTIADLIGVDELQILKFDPHGDPFYRLALRGSEYDLVQESIAVADDLGSAIDGVRSSGAPVSFEAARGRIITTWPILDAKSQLVVLSAKSEAGLDESSLQIVSGLLGVYRNYHRVLSESQLDQLTGLANRKTFEDAVNKIHLHRHVDPDSVEVDRRASPDDDNSDFWLCIADLDHFKRINDIWGHLYGDEVLLLTSQLMRDHFRKGDYLFRFGGEEFVILLSALSQEHAVAAIERFRVAMERFRFPQVGQVTLSIGITRLEPGVLSAILVDRADKALYHAKENGRNRTCSYEELLAAGLVEEKEIVTGEIEMF